MPAAGVVLILAVVLIIAVLAVFLIPTILALRQISVGLDRAIKGVGELVEKSAPVEPVVTTINANLDAAVEALEGLLVKKAGLDDAVGLIDGLYPGAAADGLRNFPESRTVTPPRIAEVYTKGTLTLARLGREAPIAAASPDGPVLRDVASGSSAARALYPEIRQTHPPKLQKSPVIGTDAPVKYEPSEAPGVRRVMPGDPTIVWPPPPPHPPAAPDAPAEPETAASGAKKDDTLHWKTG